MRTNISVLSTDSCTIKYLHDNNFISVFSSTILTWSTSTEKQLAFAVWLENSTFNPNFDVIWTFKWFVHDCEDDNIYIFKNPSCLNASSVFILPLHSNFSFLNIWLYAWYIQCKISDTCGYLKIYGSNNNACEWWFWPPCSVIYNYNLFFLPVTEMMSFKIEGSKIWVRMYVYSPILACDASSALLWNWEEEIFTTQQYLFSEYFYEQAWAFNK